MESSRLSRKAKVIVPSFIQAATFSTHAGFASEVHDIARGFSPRVTGEVLLSAAYLFEQLGVEDVQRFSLRVDRIDPFEGPTSRFPRKLVSVKRGRGR